MSETNIVKRVLVIAAGVPLVIFILKLGVFSTFALILLIAVVCAIEFYGAVSNTGHKPYSGLGLAFGTVYLFSVFFNSINFAGFSKNDFSIMLIFVFILAVFSAGLFRKNQIGVVHSASLTIGGFMYIFFCLGFLIPVADLRPGGFKYILSLLVITWATDIGAFIVGMSIGRIRPLAHVSPGKTLEGFCGGLLFAGIAAFSLSGFLSVPKKPALIIGLILGLSGQLGDLLESSIKRSCNVKDTGVILPGHGGFLDRFDSLIINAPVYYFCLKYLIKT